MSILIKSPVEFNEELHRYSLGDKRLMGITGLIHSVLELGAIPMPTSLSRKWPFRELANMVRQSTRLSSFMTQSA